MSNEPQNQEADKIDPQAWRQALADLKELREKNPPYEGDLVNEARKEREEQMERVWRTGSAETPRDS